MGKTVRRWAETRGGWAVRVAGSTALLRERRPRSQAQRTRRYGRRMYSVEAIEATEAHWISSIAT